MPIFRYAFLAALLAAGPAQAANDSVFTDLDIEKCPVTQRWVPDSDPKADPEPTQWRCKGYGGWNVFVGEGDLRAGIRYARERRIEGGLHTFPKFSLTGPKVEWRGPVKGGKVVPVAAIVRFLWSVDGRKGSVLSVARLGRGEDDTCVFAYVDAVANPNANALAQKAADERAANARCPADGQPEWIGAVSEDFR